MTRAITMRVSIESADDKGELGTSLARRDDESLDSFIARVVRELCVDEEVLGGEAEAWRMKTKLMPVANDMLNTARRLVDEHEARLKAEEGLLDSEWRALSLGLFVIALLSPAAPSAAVDGTRITPRGEWITCGCRSAGECTHGTPYWKEAYPGAEKRALSKLVSAFHLQMRAKLHAKAGEAAGWAEDEFTVEKIKGALVEHILEGDPVDVANFCAFWWNRLREAVEDDDGE